ncbi:hypothetical protein [Acidithiobacillus sp.]|uniref:hypothetical protein n=1 Tax=Acidithiobacillus sp. TaxID=1872118 RepID=UPI00260B2CFE|nr:hypothetical protein [Acidithiobacillus sp.]
MAMQKPQDYDAFLDLLHQAVYEVDELRACIEDDPEEMERYVPFLDHLDAQLRQLFEEARQGMLKGFGQGEDLSYMPLFVRFERDIPFRELLRTLNAAYREGL